MSFGKRGNSSRARLIVLGKTLLWSLLIFETGSTKEITTGVFDGESRNRSGNSSVVVRWSFWRQTAASLKLS